MAAGLSAGAVALIGAGVGAAGSMAAANSAGKAAGAGAASQTQTTLMGMAQQGQQFDRVQALLNPYVQAATGSFDGAAYPRATPAVAADPYYGTHPEEHYKRVGQLEGRQGSYSSQGSLGAQQDLVGLNGADAQQ